MTYDEYIINSKELYHHGILGMKWGIRRYQPYPPGKHGTFLGQTRDEDIRIKKGTTAYRVQNTSNLSDRAGQMYASITSKDNIKYIESSLDGSGGVAMDFNMENGNNGQPYVVKMKFTEDIVAPSYRESMEAFCETFGDVSLKKVVKQLDGYKGKSKAFVKERVKELSDMGIKDARDQSYLLFMGTMMDDTKARSAFIENLKAKGYNAIVDDWDNRFGKNSYTDAPIIIFDRNKSAKQVSSMKLSDKILEIMDEASAKDAPWDTSSFKKQAASINKDFDKFYDDDSWKSHPWYTDTV